MLRRVLCCMALGMALLAGGCSSDDDVTNVAGSWNMVANVDYSFTLVLNQDGKTITGSMIPIAPTGDTQNISGTIDADDSITFTRSNATGVYQTYTGSVTGGGSSMSGTFTHVGVEGSFAWAATKI